MLEIKGYEGLYSITSCGRIYSHRSKKFLKPVIDRTNYYVVTLSKNNKKKKFLIHRLVLETYLPVDQMELLEVNHKDENKLNNCLNNLEWVTKKQNINYGSRNKRAGEKIKIANTNNPKLSYPIYCEELNQEFPSIREAARQLKLDSSFLSKQIKRNRKAYGLTWRYKEEI